MTKLLTTLLIITISQAATAQCKREIDPFEKDTITTSDTYKIGMTDAGSTDYLSLRAFKRSGGMCSLTFYAESHTRNYAEGGDLVKLLFEDETVMSLEVALDAAPSKGYGQSFTQGSAVAIYTTSVAAPITREQIALLKQKPIKKIRCNGNDYDIDGNKRVVMQKVLKCM
jgi:hypothetical protein